MGVTKQKKAKNAESVRDTTLTFRTGKRIKALADVAARSQGVKTSNYIEQVLQASFDSLMVDKRDEGEEGVGDRISTLKTSSGRPLSEVADELYDEDDYVCLFKRITHHQWALSPEQYRLYELLQISPVLHPKPRSYNEAATREHWDVLNAVANGSASVDALPKHLFSGADVAFALMNEAERVALYSANRDEFMRRSKAHNKASKGGK
jgi:hypothetical protein